METTTTHGLPDRYADAELVARGGMGEVWKALDTQLDRPVAVKLLRDGAGNEPPETLLMRFKREARAIAHLSSHHSIVTVFDVGETHDGAPYMTMQWLGGGTLPVDRATGDWSDRDALRWLAQTASGLDAAHRANIVHRDVKPGNILLDENGEAHVGDFGIAQLQGSLASALTQTGALVGTASYMSPEQATGHPAEPASDQYALASIAYEMLVGERPFRRDNAVAELAAHVADPLPRPSERRPELPLAVDAVFERAMAKEPEQRFVTCRAFVEELEAAMATPAASDTAAADGALSTTTVLPVVERDYTTRPLVPVEAQDVQTRGRSWRNRGLAALVALAVVGGIAVAATRNDEPATTDRSAHATKAAPHVAAAVTKHRTANAKATATPSAAAQSHETEPTKQSAPAPTPAPTHEPTAAAPAGQGTDQHGNVDEAIAQHERAFKLLQQGRYQEALAESQSALAALVGVKPYEAYANYNVGASLIGLGRGSEALPYLDRSEQLQGSRSEITAARAKCSGAT